MEIDLDALKDEIWDNNGCGDVACNECEYYRTWEEGHPYGMTTAYETLSECIQDEPLFCPGMKVKLTAIREQVDEWLQTIEGE